MPTIYTFIAYVSFIVLWLVWLPGYFITKRTVERPNPIRRVVAMVFIIAGYVLLFSRFGIWTMPVTPQTIVFGIIGLAIDLVFVTFAIWARITLGGNWSNAIALKEGHELVRRGPYAIVRHPIYTGMLFSAFGVALTLGSLYGYLGVVLFLIGVLIRIRDEDALMARQFPNEYPEYRKQTRTLIPFIW